MNTIENRATITPEARLIKPFQHASHSGTLHTYMYARNHCFSLFRMKTVADLRMLINGYKKDVSEDGSLLAPDVTNGLVLYINSTT